MNYQGLWPAATDQVRSVQLDSLAAAGNEWVRMDVAWESFQPNNSGEWKSSWIDERVREVTSRGMKILMMFYWAPDWAVPVRGSNEKNGRPSPDLYASAAAKLAKYYDGTIDPLLKIHAIEVWNEPDLDLYWESTPETTRISDFAKLVRAAGPKIRQANPSLEIVTGGPTSVDTDFYREFYKTPGVVGTYDALGVHPYQSPGDAPPDAYDAKWGKYYLRHIPVLSDLMTANGDGADIWATEYGWSSHDNSSYGGTANTPNYRLGVTLQEQADYLIGAQNVFSSFPRLKAAFWYNAVNTKFGDAMEDNRGLLRSDLTRKPAYFAFKCVASGICGPPAGSALPYLVPAESTWSYDDAGSDRGSGWRAITYDDSRWKVGRAELGYGDGDERTLLMESSTGDGPKSITTYLRRRFNVDQVGVPNAAIVRLKVDDGARAFVNGTEVARVNLPSGEVTSSTLAVYAVSGADEGRWRDFPIPTGLLRTGTNVIAVEVHQASTWSSDVTFDAEVRAVR